MVKAIYTTAVEVTGREAFVGEDKMTYKYVDIPDEATFQKIKNEVIEEFKNEDTHLVKVSFYNDTNVPFEISFEDIDEDDETNQIDSINSMTLDKIENDKETCPKWQWEMYNNNLENAPDDENEFEKFMEEFLKSDKCLLK